MKARVTEVFKDSDLIQEVIEILKKNYLLREKQEEMTLADFVRVCSSVIIEY